MGFEAIKKQENFLIKGANELYSKIKNKSDMKYINADCIDIFDEIEKDKGIVLTKEQEDEILMQALVKIKKEGKKLPKALNDELGVLVVDNIANKVAIKLIDNESSDDMYTLVSSEINKLEKEAGDKIIEGKDDEMEKSIKKKCMKRLSGQKNREKRLNDFGVYFDEGEFVEFEKEEKQEVIDQEKEKKQEEKELNKKIEEVLKGEKVENIDLYIQKKFFEETEVKIKISRIKELRVVIDKKIQEENRRKKGRMI